MLRLIRRPRNGESLRETIDEMIEEPPADGPDPLGAQERVLIGNILKGHDRTAADVMVPRVDIVALDVETPFPEVVKCMIEQGHSRVPVYRETLDDVIGFIHVKDMLPPVADRRETKLAPLLRKVLFVAPSVPILDLLVQMRQARTHIAMVVDEFGGIDGLVTIEDLIEEIVGEIEDEHDVSRRPRPDRAPRRNARSPMPAPRSRRSRSGRASGCARSATRKRSTRWAGSFRPSPAACPNAARSSPTRAGSNSRCSKPIRGGSSDCACAACRQRTARWRATQCLRRPLFRIQAGLAGSTRRCAGWRRRIAALTGWRRYGLAFVLGGCAAAALPPFDLTPLLAVAFPGLLWLDDGSAGPGRRSGSAGSLVSAFFSPGSTGSPRRCLSTSTASGGWCRLPRLGCRRPLRFISGWRCSRPGSRADTCICRRRRGYSPLPSPGARPNGSRGHALTGLPWNLIGYAWSGGFPAALAVLQSVAWVGIYGLSFVTVLAASLPALLGTPAMGPMAAVRRWAPAIVAGLLILFPATAGAIRLETMPTVLDRDLVAPGPALDPAELEMAAGGGTDEFPPADRSERGPGARNRSPPSCGPRRRRRFCSAAMRPPAGRSPRSSRKAVI